MHIYSLSSDWCYPSFSPNPFSFIEFISHICRCNSLSPSHSQWMTSLLFFMEKTETTRRAQPDRLPPDLLTYYRLFTLPASTPVTKVKGPCPYIRTVPSFVTWVLLLVFLQVHCRSSFPLPTLSGVSAHCL